MSPALWMGVMLATAGGASQGALAVRMKYARQWKHENVWFVFALTGLLLLPWILTAATVPSLGEVYRSAPAGSLIFIAASGIGWGNRRGTCGNCVSDAGDRPEIRHHSWLERIVRISGAILDAAPGIRFGDTRASLSSFFGIDHRGDDTQWLIQCELEP